MARQRRTRVVGMALGLLGLAVSGGCGAGARPAAASASSATAAAAAPAPAAATAGIPAAPAPAPEIQFEANYPASVFHALSAASSPMQKEPAFRKLLVGDEAAPWLDAFAARRPSWNQNLMPDLGGGAPAFDRCGWDARDLDEALRCAEATVPEADREIARTAITEVDRRLRPHWEQLSAKMFELMPSLEAGLETATARELFAMLRRATGLSDDAPLRFRVILVAKPHDNLHFAYRVGQQLVVEVGPERTAGGLLAVAFHEITHLANYLSPERGAMDAAFARLGDAGRPIAGLWDESLATAFGNGLAAERLDPGFDSKGSFYAEPWIDALGKALYAEWKAGRDIRIGAELAAHLVELGNGLWPADQRPLASHLQAVGIQASDIELGRAALRNVPTRSVGISVPVDDSLAVGPRTPPWAPRIALVTAADLAQRPALVARAGIPAGSWTRALGRGGAALFRHDDPDGTLVLIVVGRDRAALRAATEAFTRLPAMVAPGWTAIPL